MARKTKIAGLIAIVLIGIFLITLIFTKKQIKQYHLSTSEILSKVRKFDNTISPQQFVDITFSNDSVYRFIDLRSANVFSEGHLKGAINIPVHRVLDKEYEYIFNQDKKINILYYSDHCGACGPWMILTQLGYKNNRILMGGYDYVKGYILDKYSPMSGDYQAEKAKYDYARIIGAQKGNSVSSSASTKGNNPVVPIVRKKKSGGGGC